VSLPGGLTIGAVADHVSPPSGAPPGKGADAAVDADTVVAPMQGNVIKVAVEDGQQVAKGDLVIVLEAMKMENPITAHKAGTVTGLAVQPGASIPQGAPIAQLK
jgi:acetyl-CoA/propionyl-CoA carboxylase, biotin carboxylase, biotin carboxyl carrier protein